MHPPSQRLDHRQALANAAAKGKVSAFSAGLEPGFAGDHLPLVLTISVVVKNEEASLNALPRRGTRRAAWIIERCVHH